MHTHDPAVDQMQRMIGEWQSFLDSAIHDLRAPLRGIGTSAELLVEACGQSLNSEVRRLISAILDGVAQIEALSKSLAIYSRALQADKPPCESIRLESAVRAALAELEGEIRQRGAVVKYGPLPRVRGNHEQLTALFRALLSNALLYQGSEPPSIHITAQREQDQWRFAVRDNGIGIEPKYFHQIFQPFQRLRAGPAGVGLGLTICQKIVEAHGGTIWVESQLQAGSTFCFILPAAPDMTAQVAEGV